MRRAVSVIAKLESYLLWKLVGLWTAARGKSIAFGVDLSQNGGMAGSHFGFTLQCIE